MHSYVIKALKIRINRKYKEQKTELMMIWICNKKKKKSPKKKNISE